VRVFIDHIKSKLNHSTISNLKLKMTLFPDHRKTHPVEKETGKTLFGEINL